MARKRQPAKEAATHRSPTDVRIDHAFVVDNDLDWLHPVEWLTLWNVILPDNFLGMMGNLRWLDLRGGSATDLQVVRDLADLQYLQVLKVRGMRDLEVLQSLVSLRFLALYGLPMVTEVPSLVNLRDLRRVEVGSMKGLHSLDGVLAAPQLQELMVLRQMGPGSVDPRAISKHPTLRRFSWIGEDVPVSTWEPIVKAVGLPEVTAMHPEEWFAAQQTD